MVRVRNATVPMKPRIISPSFSLASQNPAENRIPPHEINLDKNMT